MKPFLNPVNAEGRFYLVLTRALEKSINDIVNKQISKYQITHYS